MDKSQDLFNLTARLADYHGPHLLNEICGRMLQDGYAILLLGVHQTTLRQEGSATLTTPFAVAQTQEQIEKLKKGILEGKIYGPKATAVIEGTINAQKIEFEKRYELHVPDELDEYVMKALIDFIDPTPEQLERIESGWTEAHLVEYTGVFVGNSTYEGRWIRIRIRDDSCGSCRGCQGTFKMIKGDLAKKYFPE